MILLNCIEDKKKAQEALEVTVNKAGDQTSRI